MKKETKSHQEIIEDRRHPSRTEEKRSFESREMERRPIGYMERRDKLTVRNIPDGVEYTWIRGSTLNEPDNSNLVEAAENGWRPVPASRHPEMVCEDFFGRKSHLDGHIERKGGILCEREKYLCEEERQYYEKVNREQLQSIPSSTEWTAHQHMPGFVQTNKTSFGQTPYG